MSYYQLNRNRSLEKEKDMSHNGGGNEKAAEHYLSKGEVLRENEKHKCRSLSEQEKGNKKRLKKR